MATSDHPAAYRPVAIALHWLVAALVLSTIPTGVVMLIEDLPRATQDTLFIYHKNVGVLIFVLVVLRIAYRIVNPPPPLPTSVPTLQRRIAWFTHVALYALLLVMTISGYTYVRAGDFPIEMLDALGVPSLVPVSEQLSETALSVHLITRFAVIALIAMHIGAALFHGLVRRDGVFTRMVPILRR